MVKMRPITRTISLALFPCLLAASRTVGEGPLDVVTFCSIGGDDDDEK